MPNDGDHLILIDTSAWIHFLRPKGEPFIAGRVPAALRHAHCLRCNVFRVASGHAIVAWLLQQAGDGLSGNSSARERVSVMHG